MKKVQNSCLLLIFAAAAVITGCQESTAKKADASPVLQAEKPTVHLAEVTQPAQPQAPAPDRTPATKPREEVKPVAAAKGAKIQVTKEFHDFGNIGPGTHHVCEFTFRNIGTETLKIENVQSTCGCSVPQLEKNDFAPGESGKVEVRFHAPSTKGETKKQLYIISNDVSNPRAQLEVRAFVVVNVVVHPEEVSLMLNKPNAGLVPITVKGLDDRKFSITKFSSTNDAITCPFDPAQKATEFILNPVVDTAQLAKYLNGVIQIEVDHPEAGALMVRYTTLPQYEINRPRIILQNAKPGQKERKEVLITSHYGDTLKIKSSSSRLGIMKIIGQQIVENSLNLTIEISIPDQEAANKRYISDELTIKFENDQEVVIRTSGWFQN